MDSAKTGGKCSIFFKIIIFLRDEMGKGDFPKFITVSKKKQ